ncbi:MAG: molybdopterin-dependent oxidoreductase [Pseudomonadales bacterium]
MSESNRIVPTCTHWGNYRVESDGESIVAIHAYQADKEPTAIGQSLLNALDGNVRIPQPMIRAGYLENGLASNGRGRGQEPFVAVSWDTALKLASMALQHTKEHHGPDSIYGGSYGWSSAGRFHHAQSQIHRFLRLNGGYVASVNSYSAAAAEVIIKHILGFPLLALLREAPPPAEIAEHCKTAVFFGGAALKNTQVNAGGIGTHSPREQLLKLKQAGVKVVNISPIRDDVFEGVGAHWLACRPGSDVAIMLGMAHTLYTEGLHDQEFLDKYTVGFDQFIPYMLGENDGQPKSAEWAETLADISANDIQQLARDLTADRSLLGISWSLQRQEYGEQTWWMITTLGAMLGDIGLPGSGVGYGYGCIHNMGFGGRKIPNYKMGAFGAEIGERVPPAGDFIPVARITDMLNNPRQAYVYNGQTRTYPDIKLIYWAGGNPYHHHQDLNALEQAWSKPETIIVNEAFWTATARHADIVFPCTTSLERNDFGGSSYDDYISPMPAAVKPFEQSRDDFDVFRELAARLGFEQEYTCGRDEMDWVKHLYEKTRESAADNNVALPEFDEFWKGEQIYVGNQLPDAEFALEKFRRDPKQYPLNTPSGKIEIYSQTIAGFNYADCEGHAKWFDHNEWLGGSRAKRFTLHMVSNQPKTRLHSQYDHGVTSRKHKIQDRERARLNANEAKKRGLGNGDVIRVFNDRGACLAGLEISDGIRDGVLELPTGAWFDPQTVDGSKLEVHGNPNVLTPDRGTSSLAQGCSAHSCLVEVEKYNQELPTVQVFKQPTIKAIS